MKIIGSDVRLVKENALDHPDGRVVDAQRARGGQATSTTDGQGNLKASLLGPLDRGRPAEGDAIKRLVKVLRDQGKEVQLIDGAKDSEGKDQFVSIDGTKEIVQVISLPLDPSIWRKFKSQGTTEIVFTSDQALEMLREAFLAKCCSTSGRILLIDAANIGAIVQPQLLVNYLKKYGDPEVEFGFRQAWILGETSNSAIRLSAAKARG